MIIREVEKKILVNVPKGKNVVDEIISLKRLDEFRLTRCAYIKIRDAYLDNKDFLLASNKGYLRIRGKPASRIITISKKVLKKSSDNYAVDEISHPLNDQGVSIVLAELAEKFGVNGNAQTVFPFFSEIFGSLGFNEVLRVELDRMEREIYHEDVRIGLMKIDTIGYSFPSSFRPFYELEIAYYKKAFKKSIDDFISLLMKDYGKAMEMSQLCKYIRGINIAYGWNFK